SRSRPPKWNCTFCAMRWTRTATLSAGAQSTRTEAKVGPSPLLFPPIETLQQRLETSFDISVLEEEQGMAIHPLAGKPAPADLLIEVSKLEREFQERRPNLSDARQLVSFGTSGHRGTPLDGTFTEAHILAITQAICEYRRKQGIDGPLYMGKDTHALSGP